MSPTPTLISTKIKWFSTAASTYSQTGRPITRSLRPNSIRSSGWQCGGKSQKWPSIVSRISPWIGTDWFRNTLRSSIECRSTSRKKILKSTRSKPRLCRVDSLFHQRLTWAGTSSAPTLLPHLFSVSPRRRVQISGSLSYST